MDASLSVQSRNAGDVGRGRKARFSWLRRALGGLLTRKQPAAAVEAPAPAPTEPEIRTLPPHRRSSLKKAVGSALARVARIIGCKPVCSGGHDGDVAEDPRRSRGGRRRRRRSFRSLLLGGESEDDYWTYGFRGRSPSFVDDVLMRRYVMQEEAMHRRMEMRMAAGYGHGYWFPPGPSRLSQMSLADDGGGDGNGNGDEAGEKTVRPRLSAVKL